MKQIFLSYVEEDSEIARSIAVGLEQSGYLTWYYERDSLPGANYLWQMGEAIEQASVFLLLISPDSLGSRQVTSEVVRAYECGKLFLPVLRGLTHAEFQRRQPIWRQAIGAAASIRLPAEGVSAILSSLLAGVKSLGLHPVRSSTVGPMTAREGAAVNTISSRARCLQDLATDVRNRTIQLLQAASPSESTWTPPGTSNHILWHAGHALWAEDVLCIQLVTGSSELPRGWDEMFRMGSRPALWKQPWPAKEELLSQLRAQLPRLIHLIGSLSETQMNARPPFPHRGDTRALGESILHGLHDEANHQGEMYLLLKMQRLSLYG
jgi:hypothetical protein